MIPRLIDWCTANRFLVFAAVALLMVGGLWSIQHVPLDALPDISDVQVIVHTTWAGQPPNLIEDQVTYPIVSSMLAAPQVKAVRAQTMFGDSYVYVVFQDSTDLYWARSRVLEYLQAIQGRLPANAKPILGPDATGAGWVFEYALVDRTHKRSLADLRSQASGQAHSQHVIQGQASQTELLESHGAGHDQAHVDDQQHRDVTRERCDQERSRGEATLDVQNRRQRQGDQCVQDDNGHPRTDGEAVRAEVAPRCLGALERW